MAGKMNALLHWETTLSPSGVGTGGKGEPVAIRARPSVQAIRSAGTASARLDGFDSGKITGRATRAAMPRTMASVKAPAAVENPMRTVGSKPAMTEAKSGFASRDQFRARTDGTA